MKSLSIVVLLFLVVHTLDAKSAENQFHTQLGKEDLENLFQVQSHDEVPEYDVIHLNSRVRRSSGGSYTRSVHLKAFGKEKVIHLKSNKDLNKHVPVFFADSHEKGTGVKLTPLMHTGDIGVPYQDEATMTAVMIKHHSETGHFLMDGTIGDELVVRSVPVSLHGLLPPSVTHGREEEGSENSLLEDDHFFSADEEPFQDDLVFSDGLPLEADDEFVTGSSIQINGQSTNSSTSNTKESLPEGLLLLRKRRSISSSGVHLIYKRKNTPVETDFAMMEMDQIPSASAAKKSRSKREAPYVIYPEILVLVDYDGYLMHGKDNAEIKKYYVSFWNGVDLRYKLLSNPKVKISIAGIIISRSRDAMPYLERNRVGRDAIDSASALTDMGKYLYQERRLPTYDIAVAITKYDLCRRRKSGNCTTGTAGFAYVGGACVVNKRLQKVNSVAIVEDTGGFSGIIVAAHEVGHLLGAVHDGSPPPSYLGGPGARRCKWKDGYIMSDLRHTEKGFRWSPCSIKQFHHFLNGETATCLYNLPHEDESLPRVLPGKRLSLDKQCRMDRGTLACFKDQRVCAQLFCFDSSSGFCVSYRPAAEGSPCGNGKICLNGKCEYDNENSIDHGIHSHDDNFLDGSNPATESSSTSSNVPKTTTSTTTRAPFSTKRSTWWKYNNRWTKKPISTTTTHFPPITTKRSKPKWTAPSTTKWTTHSTARWTTPSTTRWTTPPTTRRTTPSTARWTPLSTTKRITPSTTRWTPPSTTRRTTPSTTRLTTQSTTRRTTQSTTRRTTPSTTRWTTPSTTRRTTPSTTRRTTPSTTRWTTTMSTKTISATNPSSTTDRTTILKSTTSSNSTETKSHTSFTTFSPVTYRRTTEKNRRYPSTTTKSKRPTPPYRSRNKNKSKNKLNSVKSNDSNTCEDSISNIAGSLTCQEFLKNYGFRYCNHRYIQKNCCRSKKEMCTDQ